MTKNQKGNIHYDVLTMRLETLAGMVVRYCEFQVAQCFLEDLAQMSSAP